MSLRAFLIEKHAKHLSILSKNVKQIALYFPLSLPIFIKTGSLWH